MCFAWQKKESISDLNRRRAVLMSNCARAGNDVVELPLRAVRMIRVSALAGWNAEYLDVKRMTLHQVGGEWLAPQRFRNFFAGTGEFLLRRRPCLLGNV